MKNAAIQPLTKSQKARWLEALRSGEFPQSRGELRNTSGYCCLGVLQKICNLNSDSPYTLLRHDNQNENEYIYLTAEIQGLLTNMNDTKGLNFLQIADWVESNVETVDDSQGALDVPQI